MSQTTMDADLRSIQQARDLAVGAREAMRSFQFASQQQVDKICEAMVAAAVREAERLGQLAHDETGFGYAAHKRLKNEFAAQGCGTPSRTCPPAVCCAAMR